MSTPLTFKNNDLYIDPTQTQITSQITNKLMDNENIYADTVNVVDSKAQDQYYQDLKRRAVLEEEAAAAARAATAMRPTTGFTGATAIRPTTGFTGFTAATAIHPTTGFTGTVAAATAIRPTGFTGGAAPAGSINTNTNTNANSNLLSVMTSGSGQPYSQMSGLTLGTNLGALNTNSTAGLISNPTVSSALNASTARSVVIAGTTGTTGSAARLTTATPGSMGTSTPNLNNQSTATLLNTIVKKANNCNDNNNVCFFESYENEYEHYQGMTSIKTLQETVNKYKNVSKPVGRSRWLAADKSFNVGYDEIMVASLYYLTVNITKNEIFTIFTSNRGYLFINDQMYFINKGIGGKMMMCENILLSMNGSAKSQSMRIMVLLPGNSAMMINNNTLVNTMETNWKSKSYVINRSFKDINPIDFAIKHISSNPISDVENVMILRNFAKSVGMSTLDYSDFICNTASYKSYDDKSITTKSNLNIRTMIYVPGDEIIGLKDNIDVSYTVYASNRFEIYQLTKGAPKRINNEKFTTKVISSSLTLYSQNIKSVLMKGVNKIVIVAPLNTLLYIPTCNMDNNSKVEIVQRKRNGKKIEMKRNSSGRYTNENCGYNTDMSWNYIQMDIPYVQFNYMRFFDMTNKLIASHIESFEAEPREPHIRELEEKTQLSQSETQEHFENSTYTEISAKAIEHDYIQSTEKRRLELTNLSKTLNSDQLFNLKKIKESCDKIVAGYDGIVATIVKKKDDKALTTLYTNTTTKYNRAKKSIDAMKLKEAKNATFMKEVITIDTNHNNAFNQIDKLYKSIDIESKKMIQNIQNTQNMDKTSLTNDLNRLSKQLTQLQASVASQKLDDIEKDYTAYVAINRSMMAKLPKIQDAQSKYAKSVVQIDNAIAAFRKSVESYDKMALSVDNFVKMYQNRDKMIQNIKNDASEAKKIMSRVEFDGANKKNPINEYTGLIKGLYDRFLNLYNDNLSGLRKDLVMCVNNQNAISSQLKKFVKVDLPEMKSEADVAKFVNRIDLSFVWEDKSGIEAKSSFKRILTLYLQDIWKLMSAISSPPFIFPQKPTKLDSVLIKNMDESVKALGAQILMLGTLEVGKYKKIVEDTNKAYQKMNADIEGMLSNKIALNDKLINTQLLSIKKSYETLIANQKMYTTSLKSIQTQVIDKMNQVKSIGFLKQNINNDYVKNISGAIIKLIDSKRNSQNTSYEISPFSNMEHFVSKLDAEEETMESFSTQTTTKRKMILNPVDFENLPQMKSGGRVNILQFRIRGTVGNEKIKVYIVGTRNKNPSTFEYTLTKEDMIKTIKLGDDYVSSFKLDIIAGSSLVLSYIKYNGVDVKKFLVDPYGGKNVNAYNTLSSGLLNAANIKSYTYDIQKENKNRVEIVNTIWVDPHSYITTAESMSGELNVIGMYKTTSAMTNLVAKVFTNNMSNVIFYVNGEAKSLDENGFTKDLFNLEDGINFIQIRLQLTSNIQEKYRYLTVSVKQKSTLATIKNASNQSFDSNSEFLWRYNFEKNGYLQPVILPTYKDNNTCTTYCTTKPEEIKKLSPKSSGKSLCLNSVKKKDVVDCNVRGVGKDDVNCRCLPFAFESFENENEIENQNQNEIETFASKARYVSSYYGGANISGTTDFSMDFEKNPQLLLANKSKVNAAIIHKVPVNNDSYITGMTFIDTNNNVYNAGNPLYESDIQSRMFHCDSGFVGMKSKMKANVLYNAAFECNVPIQEHDVDYMAKLTTQKPGNYQLISNTNYTSNDLFHDRNIKHSDCMEKCDKTPNCVGYTTNKANRSTKGCSFKKSFNRASRVSTPNNDTYYIIPSRNDHTSPTIPTTTNPINIFY